MDSGSLTLDNLKKYKEKFVECGKNLLALNTVTKFDPLVVSTSRKVVEETQFAFEYNVEGAGKPITNQKSAGSCWLYASLNTMRIPFMKAQELEDFEFSQSYLFFWHKVELCNFWLNNIVKTAKLNEPLEGRLSHHLFNDPCGDGGQWDMMVSLVKKYGLMPKDCFPSSYTTEFSSKMNNLLKSLLRLYGKELREMVQKKATDAELDAKIQEQMYEIFKVIAICFSIPPEKFTWEYMSKSGWKKIGPITPLEFYTKYVKPVFNLDDKVCLVNDPRPTSSYGTAYTVQYLGNMVGGKPIIYNNQPIELLMKLTVDAIKSNEPVWFGCDTARGWSTAKGIADMNLIDYNGTFGLKNDMIPKKCCRMMHYDSLMGHAMVFVGVSFNEKSEPIRFKVENSWGEDSCRKGYLSMTSTWFNENVFEIVVDKKFVSQEVLDVFKQVPKELPAWDPMGTVAK